MQQELLQQITQRHSKQIEEILIEALIQRKIDPRIQVNAIKTEGEIYTRYYIDEDLLISIGEPEVTFKECAEGLTVDVQTPYF